MNEAARILILFLALCGTGCAYAVVNCKVTGPGRYADMADETCKNYTLCIYSKSKNNYIAHKAVCPGRSVFDPRVTICVSPNMYICKNRTKVSTIHRQTQICTYEGYVADRDDKNCSTYFKCVNISGAFIGLRQNCPKNTYFNPNTTLCENDYKCKELTCSSPGRFADTTDFTCHKYYRCVLLNNGTYAQLEFSCPADSMFNPKTKMCIKSNK